LRTVAAGDLPKHLCERQHSGRYLSYEIIELSTPRDQGAVAGAGERACSQGLRRNSAASAIM